MVNTKVLPVSFKMGFGDLVNKSPWSLTAVGLSSGDSKLRKLSFTDDLSGEHRLFTSIARPVHVRR